MTTDTERLEYLTRKSLTVKRLGDTNLWMVLDLEGFPAVGSEFEDFRDAIDECMEIYA